MSIVYTWKIGQLEIVPSEDGLQNVVKNISWSLVATDGDCSVATEGQSDLAEPDKQSFVSFNDLTPSLVESWIESSMDAELLATQKANLAVYLQETMKIKTKSVTPPWKGL